MDWVKIVGLLIISVFYISYFTKQILLRKQGIQTNRLGKGKKPKRTLYIEAALMTVTYLMGVVQLVSIITSNQVPMMVDKSWLRGVGLLLGVLGVAFFIAAIITMKDSWRAGVDHSQETKFVSNGVYKVSRNPAFVGFDLLYVGIGLAFSNPIQSLLVLVAIILFHLQILEEEKFLIDTFGKPYREYQDQVGRYF